MDKILYDILNNVNEGIIITDEEFKIFFWNSYMECVTGEKMEKILNENIYEVLPGFNKNYFDSAADDVLNNGHKAFFSAAMHKELSNGIQKFNLKISRLANGKTKLLFFELNDVTNEFERVGQLKGYINELCLLNRKLQKKEKIIRNLAYYDKLTGVANRVLFYEIAERFLNEAKRNNSLLGLMFIDVDNFKSINDTYGHKAGDKALAEIAGMLTKCTRKNDVVARFGGDEFLILLPYIKNFDNYKVIASRITKSRNKIKNSNGEDINISLSIGVSFYPYDGESINELMEQADKAMYDAKHIQGQDSCLCSTCSSVW